MSLKKNRRLAVEPLQSRELMAVDLISGELQISGTSNSDQIEISEETRNVLVYRSGLYRLVSQEMVRVKISDLNGRAVENRLFNASQVDRVMAEGLGGNDEIINDTDLPSVLYGNAGDDVLRGGSGDDFLIGGDHNDSLYGRDGQDFLSGGGGNDGLFGGEDFDRLYGGSGANRYLNTKDGDFMYRPDSNDAVIDFRSGSYGFTSFGYFTGSSWSDEQVETVDLALRRIHDRTGSTRLLKLADGRRMQIVHKGHQVFGDSGIGGWNYNNVVYVHHGTFNFGDAGGLDNDMVAQQLIIHEIGHNWDTPEENASVSQFRALSGWSRDGQTHAANVETDFARTYGATNAMEDFATTFAAHFMEDQYVDFNNAWEFADYSDREVMQRKLSYMDFFDSIG